MRYKNIGLRTIAMMIAISVVCTSVPVYAEEIEEYITETSDSGSGSDSDSSDNNLSKTGLIKAQSPRKLLRGLFC